MKIDIKIEQKIANFKKQWDEFLPESHHLKSSHLQAFEDAKVDDIESFYIQIYSKGKLLGILYLQQFQFQHKHLNFSDEQQVISKIIKILLPKKIPLLVCGHLFRINFQGFYFKNESHKTLIFDVIKKITKESGICKPKGIIIKDCEDVFIEQNSNLFGYQFFNGDVTMELQRRPHWFSFDDYLNDLHKKYLQRARKIIKAFDGIEKRELNAEEIMEQAEVIKQLYWQVVNKQSVKLGTINTHYFYEMKKDLYDKFEFHAFYKNQVMIGFYTLIFYDVNRMETHYIGIDYEENKTHQIYFNILFFAAKRMIEDKYNRLELGRTARDAKANLGALPKQIFNYINVKNIFVKFTLNYFQNKFNEMESKNFVSRTPLK
ncbi:MAG: hypothetical protein EBZ58_07215 [Bacteroidetes bacterium]|nr:hypothetical protein [Bacteroidota bacterium]